MPYASTAAPARRLAPAWPLAALALYLAVMVGQAALLAPSGRSDDLETLLLSQSLEWGYESKNPPAFYWLAHAVTAVTGPTLPAIYALRLTGVFLMFAGLYAIARRLQPDPALAACAGFAMLATLHFHWYLLFFLTNTSLAMALGPAAVLALYRVKDRPTAASCALFGLVLGLGLLCRYNYAIFAAALLAAAFAAPDWRARLLRPQALLIPAVIALLLAPHLAWVAGHFTTLSAQVGDQLAGDGLPYAARVLSGLANLAVASVSILIFPLGLLAVACFPRAFRRIRVADPGRASDIALLGRTVLIALALMVAYVAAGSDYVRPHHLFFLALAPLWLIARLDRATLRPRAAQAFAGGLAACAALAVLAYPFEHYADAADCEACEEFQPVDRYAAALGAAGFEHGTILALSRRQSFPTPALRRYFPGARMLASDYPVYAPPANATPGACLLVWNGSTLLPPGMAPGSPIPRLGVPIPADARLGAVDGTVHLTGRPAQGMRYALIPGGLGDCR